MTTKNLRLTRRDVLRAAGTVAGMSFLPAVAWPDKEDLVPTPYQGEGPFFPVEIPLDHDNDLVHVAGRTAQAKGTVTNVVGTVLDDRGRPVTEAQLEIWQCDANGRYHHPDDKRDAPPDDNFQGYGRFLTGDDGAYRFRTIKPVHYSSRTAHIHFKISGPGVEPLTTQMYIAGEPRNARDGLYNRIRDQALRDRITIQFEEEPSETAELIARFDIVLIADGRFERA